MKVPTSGPLFLYNCCVKKTSISIVDYVHDIQDILAKNSSFQKPVICLITDGGPNWSPKSNVNQFFLGRLWRDGNYDLLVSACYAPGLSRYNPIEHLWSPCLKWLAGVSLPACLRDECSAPALQSLSTEELARKEKQVFSNALDVLDGYWNGKIHDGFQVTSVGVKEGENVHFVPPLKDFDAVKEMQKSSLRTIRRDTAKSKLLHEWQYYVKHMDR